MPGEEPPPAEPAEPTEPEIRVGLAVGAAGATLGGGAPLVVTDPAGVRLAMVPAGEPWRLAADGAGITLTAPGGGGTTPAAAIAVVGAGADDPVQVNGRPYRGTVEVLRERDGLTLVNRLGMEAYLQGVEIGRAHV